MCIKSLFCSFPSLCYFYVSVGRDKFGWCLGQQLPKQCQLGCVILLLQIHKSLQHAKRKWGILHHQICSCCFFLNFRIRNIQIPVSNDFSKCFLSTEATVKAGGGIFEQIVCQFKSVQSWFLGKVTALHPNKKIMMFNYKWGLIYYFYWSWKHCAMGQQRAVTKSLARLFKPLYLEMKPKVSVPKMLVIIPRCRRKMCALNRRGEERWGDWKLWSDSLVCPKRAAAVSELSAHQQLFYSPLLQFRLERWSNQG